MTNTTLTASEIRRGMILRNVQPVTGRLLATVRVLGQLTQHHAADEPMFRVCDEHETRDDEWLIAHDRTWAVPVANLELQDFVVSHRSGLVRFA